MEGRLASDKICGRLWVFAAAFQAGVPPPCPAEDPFGTQDGGNGRSVPGSGVFIRYWRGSSRYNKFSIEGRHCSIWVVYRATLPHVDYSEWQTLPYDHQIG
jgi:hypothetical protein